MSQQRLYYFDNNATTRVAPEVVEVMLPFLRDHWGNASSAYQFGKRVAQDLEQARAQVAALIHADPQEVVFTSCGTESNNTAIHSALMLAPEKRHLVMSAVEHSANVKHAELLQKRGYEVTLLPVAGDGSLDLHRLDHSIRPDTAVVSIMWANNETGVVFPIPEIAAICRSKGVLFHTDAVQAAGKIPVNAHETGVDLLSVSAHKLHAPKGIGALYVRRQTRFYPLIIGGHQERGRRAGTENVPYIIGFGKAAELALTNLDQASQRIRKLRDRLENAVLAEIPGVLRNGSQTNRLPNTTNLAFEAVEAEAVLMLLDQLGICAATGSACSTGSLEPSHVLTAMGLPPDRARSSIRFSLGTDTTAEEVEYLVQQLPPIIAQLRSASPLPAVAHPKTP